MRKLTIFFLLMAVVMGCNSKEAQEQKSSSLVKEVTNTEKKIEGQIVVLETNQGNIELKMFPKIAPLAVENFTTHAKDGYYNGVIFHRVIKNFMIQCGDPTGTGRGGESI